VLTRIIDENLAGIRVVRAFGAQDYEMAKFDRASADALALAERRVSVRFANTSLMTFTYFLSMTLVLWAGSLKVLEGAITVGTLAEFLAFMTILQMPVRQVGMVVNAIAGVHIGSAIVRGPGPGVDHRRPARCPATGA
jgi:ATP-binding cassette subfamily B protein